MVVIAYGDLLDTTEGVICHQVNCKQVMGSGVAAQIKAQFPDVYTIYRETAPVLGEILALRVTETPELWVCNMYAQFDYGRDGRRYTDYDAFEKCLAELKRAFTGKAIHFPHKIGCGLGGGSWHKIYDLIHDILGGENVMIWRKE